MGTYIYKRKKSGSGDKTSISTTASILRRHRIVDANKILAEFKQHPDLFNIKNASASQINDLLSYDFTLFAPYVDINSMPIYDKLKWIKKQPIEAHKHINLHKLPKYAVTELVRNTPSIADVIDIPLSKVTEIGWQSLINHDSKYLVKLVEYMSSLRNKTELRRLIVSNVGIFSMLTIEAMQAAPISAKEWALLLLWPDVKKSETKYSPHITEWLDQEILAEILLGNSKSSKQLNTALKALRS